MYATIWMLVIITFLLVNPSWTTNILQKRTDVSNITGPNTGSENVGEESRALGGACPCSQDLIPKNKRTNYGVASLAGKCIMCAKYGKYCERVDDKPPTLCCPTPGKKFVDCVGGVLVGNRKFGTCHADRCGKNEKLLKVRLPGYSQEVLRCDTSYGKNYKRYDFRCSVNDVCVRCGVREWPCKSDADCCSYSKCNKHNMCAQSCLDEGMPCSIDGTKCCEGYACTYANSQATGGTKNYICEKKA